ncbi:unnamed protein product [Paramecium octaurelia]|uniref:AMP deaminase n=1 Tax=Paramecium octaurelia TaxID=43137 RepID=A0A8S1X1T4_PAROT|nr:unnamed protein product [Paramecium octaurelia]
MSKQLRRLDSESDLEEPESQVYQEMKQLQTTKGISQMITEIIHEEELDEVEDKHKYMKNLVGRKLSQLDSPTESVKSAHSSKPFQSPRKTLKRDTVFFEKSDFDILSIREYDYIEIKKCEKCAIHEQSENEGRASAKKIVSLLKKRQDYNPDLQSDWNGLEEVTTYSADTQEPIVDYRCHIELLPQMEKVEIHVSDGVYAVQQDGHWLTKMHSIKEFIKDLLTFVEIANDKMISSWCYSRNKYLEQKFKMHCLFNSDRESEDQKRIKNRDFYSVLKIDTHVHHSQSMNGKQLLEFMKKKFRQCPEEVVYLDDGKEMTLKDIQKRFKFKTEELNIDLLDVQADKSLYKRFDRFTSKYSPLGQPLLRSIFLKTDNYIKGKYIAEITQDMIKNMDRHTYAEWRITIYGKSSSEWRKKAQWLIKNKLQHPNIRWIIQLPRLYSVYRKSGELNSFQDMIDNIFRPLFEVTINPEVDPDLYQALFSISAFDCVDDENQHENFFLQHLRIQPIHWTKDSNPHYAYWIYYIYANLSSLNQLRQQRGLNTLDLRPHCGLNGNIDHLACAYLLAKGINHGIILEQSPVLKYLYYLKQIGISMSPIANNKLTCKYADSPFNSYFRQGLNVCLSTDDPLMLHITDQPLLEEYAIAQQIFDLYNVDMAELARNSVRCSSFESIIKEFYVGTHYEKMYKTTNNPERNNVPQSRFLFRQETLKEEYQYLQELSKSQ